MRDLEKHERAALEAVGKRFSATWEQGSGPPDAYLTFAGKRVAVEIRSFKRRGAGRSNATRPRLRFDKVATRLLERLRTTTGDVVPDGTTVVLTVTAPIRVAAKTSAALEDRIRTLLARRSRGRDEDAAIHGNRIRIRLLRNLSERAPKFIGFVHNADSDPVLLLNMTREVLELFSVEAERPATKRAGERWLVVTSAGGSAWLEAYRDIYAQLRMATGFNKVLMAFGDGRVEMLTN